MSLLLERRSFPAHPPRRYRGGVTASDQRWHQAVQITLARVVRFVTGAPDLHRLSFRTGCPASGRLRTAVPRCHRGAARRACLSHPWRPSAHTRTDSSTSLFFPFLVRTEYN